MAGGALEFTDLELGDDFADFNGADIFMADVFNWLLAALESSDLVPGIIFVAADFIDSKAADKFMVAGFNLLFVALESSDLAPGNMFAVAADFMVSCFI